VAVTPPSFIFDTVKSNKSWLTSSFINRPSSAIGETGIIHLSNSRFALHRGTGAGQITRPTYGMNQFHHAAIPPLRQQLFAVTGFQMTSGRVSINQREENWGRLTLIIVSVLLRDMHQQS